MLVLTRKVGERIVIDGNIEMTVVQICGNKVRLGMTAPRQVSIHRREVRDRIEAAVSGVPSIIEVPDERNSVAPQSRPG